MGALSSIFYISRIKEVYLSNEAKRIDKEYKKKTTGMILTEDENMGSAEKRATARMSVMSEHIMDWRGWLKEGSFYIHGMVYMTVRIAVNVTMVNYSIS